ncbi:hypothetical protein WISP_57571 [Willisornis vidua]|uniref:Uncharacterized protein n=1 Tax=Willisornis vidua TaxID=1566151 RepID=A0ABQ9DG50_9PASS|nr:hypothetical protein WISP_57571 [Willisornis vidua]
MLVVALLCEVTATSSVQGWRSWILLNLEFAQVKSKIQTINSSVYVPAGADDASGQDAIGFLPTWTYTGSCSAALHKHPQVLFHWAVLQLLCTQSVHGVTVGKVQDLALGLVEPHTFGLSSSIHPVQIPLQNLPTLWQVVIPIQLGVVYIFTKCALNPLIQIINKDIDQNWAQYNPCGTLSMTGCQLDAAPPTSGPGYP